jgi:predicted nucleic acid-binding protein
LLVLDASVAVKWFLLADEPLKDRAMHLLTRSQDGTLDFIIPDLFWAELGNVLCKAVRQGRSTSREAKEFFRRAKDLELVAFPSEPFLQQAFDIAQTHGRSFYDSLYIALAVSRNATLITADEKLANATAAYLPVKWLGAL